MLIQLVAKRSCIFASGLYDSEDIRVTEGSIITGWFTDNGVKLLLDDCYTLPYPIKSISATFYVKGQEIQ